jgi:hypothetical protein
MEELLMVTSSAPASTSRTSTRGATVALRIGLVIAALLGIGDIVNTVTQFSDNPGDPFAYASAVFALVTLIAIPFAWRRSSAAGWTVAISRVLSSMLGLPAFFVPEVPAPFVVAAAVGIVLAVLSAVLILVGKRS